MDMMLPSGLLGWGLIVRERHESLRAEAHEACLANAARANRSVRRPRVSIGRAVAWFAGTQAGEGIDR
jgi:hypothetical protein